MPCIIIEPTPEVKEQFRKVLSENITDEMVERWGKVIQEVYSGFGNEESDEYDCEK